MIKHTVNQDTKCYVAGHRGMVGSAIMRALRAEGYTNIVTRTRHELDLTNQQAVQEFFAEERPEVVYLAAARVGGLSPITPTRRILSTTT
jgi:GDP-L-fucose synthase